MHELCMNQFIFIEKLKHIENTKNPAFIEGLEMSPV